MGQIGLNIKLLREQSKWIQKDLAHALKVSRSTLAKYETGERTPDIKTLIMLADIFQVTLDKLVGRPFQKTSTVLEERSDYLLEMSRHNPEIVPFILYLDKHLHAQKLFLHFIKLKPEKQKNILEVLEVLIAQK